ncbi:TadE/TadG family type IV pilus assembly protein [Methylobacterium sp. 77]|uniref:TadE/TadG family type IV pilus assembly protein n=1 Tax=Methylobacterium sp. 77 TaxID=1101192 RepID=UPI00036A998F|nr:TadE/TadG family type IV pilus assembly protein [Methylobacterium sp. 77]
MSSDVEPPPSNLLKRFRKDSGGAVALLFGLLSIPLLVLAGLAIDYGVNSMAQQGFQDASDSTVLSLLKLATSTTDADLQTKADRQIRAAVPKLIDADTKITVTRVENTITVAVTGKTPTSLSKIVGYNAFPLSVTSVGTRGSGNLEIALVLDNTGSMSGAKITNLKSAANDLVTALFKEVDPAKPNALKIGIVPFSMTVNVGPGNSKQDWLDKDAKASYHSQIFVSAANRLTLFGKMGIAWGGCVESRPYPYDVQDTAPSIATPDTLFVPYFAPDESDGDDYAVNDYMNDYASQNSGSSANRTRQGQINKYSTNSFKVSKTNRPNGSLSYLYGPNSGCDLQPITHLTTSQSTLTSAINAMTVIGDTNIAMGLVWGWHLLSPNGPFAEGVAYNNKDTRKFVVLMTDGQNTSAQTYSSNQSFYSGIGYIWQNRIGTTSFDAATRTNAIDTRLSTLCSNMKNAGITIFTVRVEVTDGTSDILRNCATSTDKFYDVQNSATLTDAFKAIGAQISELRISR